MDSNKFKTLDRFQDGSLLSNSTFSGSSMPKSLTFPRSATKMAKKRQVSSSPNRHSHSSYSSQASPYKHLAGHTLNTASFILNDTVPAPLRNLQCYYFDRVDEVDGQDTVTFGEIINDPSNDPAKPPVEGCNAKYIKWLLKRFVEHLYFRLITIVLIITDIGFVIGEFVIDCSVDPTATILRHLDLIISTYFLFEVTLRIIAMTPKVFFSRRHWLSMLDGVIVVFTFISTMISYDIIQSYIAKGDKFKEKFAMGNIIFNDTASIPESFPNEIQEEIGYYIDDDISISDYESYCPDENITRGSNDWLNGAKLMCEMCTPFTSGMKALTLASVGRLIRIIRFIRLIRIFLEHRNLIKGARQKISENKRRFQADGYDLDLTYVTTKVIAMSFPSKGSKQLYRNKIDNVAKFFDDKHSREGTPVFMIYNLCSEMEYDETKFHNQVQRFKIDDHNVPTLNQMQRLVDHVRKFLAGDDQRVVALHCKGGKGRTGTMICAVLIDQELFQEASESLTYFGDRRTDTNVSRQFQGVETFSQIRYVHYFERMQKEKLKVVPSRPLTVKTIVMKGLKGVGRGDGADFSVKILNRILNETKDEYVEQEVTDCKFDGSMASHVTITHKPGELMADFDNIVLVDQDAKFMFNSSSPKVPKGYDDCPFFFWLHTYFIREGVDQCENAGDCIKVILGRNTLDNPHKEKTRRENGGFWPKDFVVEIYFSEDKTHFSERL